jgi:putative MATE family efflux protein
MHQAREMGEARPASLLLKYSIPAIVGMIVNAIYNVVDRIFIGQGVGSLGIAGATVGFPIMLVQMAFGMLIGLGANALISIRLGEQRKKEAEVVLANAMVLLIFVSLLLTLAGLIFLKPLLRLLGAGEAIMPYAKDYLQVILWGTVFQAVGFGMNNFIRGEGNPKMAMKTMFIGAGLNTLLDPFFIFVLHMGVSGAAIATVISQATSAVWVLHYFLSEQSVLKIRRSNLRLQKNVVLKILAIGSAPFAMHMVASLLNAVLNNQMRRYGGDLAISVMGILYSLSMLILMPMFGINQGSQPIIGYNYGAKKFDRVRSVVKMAISAATLIGVLGFTLAQLLPSLLIKLFNPHDLKLLEMGTPALRLFFLLLPVVGFQVVSANYFLAVGKAGKAIFLALSRQLLLLLPMVLIMPRFFGLTGLWLCAPLSDLISACLTGLFLWHEMKHLGRGQEMNKAANSTDFIEIV